MTDTSTTDHDKTGRLRDGLDTARETASRAYHSGVDRASDAVHGTADVARRTVQGLESNPLGIVVGGLAVGVIAAAFLPRSQREKDLLAPLGQRIGQTARAATQAAREAGQGKLSDLGLTKDAARGQARSLIEGVVEAISTAGAAAAKSATNKAEV